jgi:hypothetical protein
MCDFRRLITSAFLALAAWTATVNPSQADAGTVRVLFSAAGVIAGVGDGRDMLTFHGKTYPGGASVKARTGGDFELIGNNSLRWVRLTSPCPR